MSEHSIIVVGGGLAGLIAAKRLSERKRHVILLEAQNHFGGRAQTILPFKNSNFLFELGSEFIHGEPPLTCALLNEYKIPYHRVQGDMVDLSATGPFQQDDGPWKDFLNAMAALNEDITLSNLLDRSFGGKKNEPLRIAVNRYANGFDLADPGAASSIALYREWSREPESQFRIQGGYGKLVNALSADCLQAGCEQYTSSPVKEIQWAPGEARVKTSSGGLFTGSKILLTVPAGVWQAGPHGTGYISIKPAIDEKIRLFTDIGFGPVIKILLLFQEPFWSGKHENASFFFTSDIVPTWWTQHPEKSNLLTGWLGGVGAKNWIHHTEEAILELALNSLALSFKCHVNDLKKSMLFSKIINWAQRPFIRGGYSFSTLYTANARKVLSSPVEDTIFFAGEAVDEGSMQGTADAALRSGTQAALKMILSLN